LRQTISPALKRAGLAWRPKISSNLVAVARSAAACESSGEALTAARTASRSLPESCLNMLCLGQAR